MNDCFSCNGTVGAFIIDVVQFLGCCWEFKSWVVGVVRNFRARLLLLLLGVLELGCCCCWEF